MRELSRMEFVVEMIGSTVAAVASAIAEAMQNRVGVEQKVQKLEYRLLKLQCVIEEAERKEMVALGDRLPLLERVAGLHQTANRAQYVLDTLKYSPAQDEGRRQSYLPSPHNPAKRICAAVGGFRRALFGGDESVSMVDDALRRVELLSSESMEIISQLESCRPREEVDGRITWENTYLNRPVVHEQIVRALLQTGNEEERVSDCLPETVLVVGAAGVGKTTLVDLVRHDERVQDHFPVTWCLDFHQVPMLRNGDGEYAMDVSAREFAERARCAKRCLLVIDHIPEGAATVTFEKWNSLVGFIRSSASRGSKIVATSRHAGVVKTPYKFQIDGFSKEEFWFYFKQQAFGNADPQNFPALMPICRRIAEKLNGNLQDARAIGTTLRNNLNAKFWEEMLSKYV